MPKISVIIPVYNVEKYIKVCLKSLISQSFKDIEIICVDDFSSDNSLNILNEFAQRDSRIKVFSNKENMGVSYSRNLALNYANGEYLSFVDPDDSIEKNTYSKILHYIDEKTDFVIWNSDFMDEKGDCFGRNVRYEQTGYLDINADKILTTNLVLWNKLFKKKLIDEKSVRFDEKCKVFEDSGFTLKYLSNAKIGYYSNDTLYHYRRRNNSITGDLTEQKDTDKYTCRILMIKDVFEYYKEHNLLNEYGVMLSKMFSNCFIQDYQQCPLERKLTLMDEAIALCSKMGVKLL